MAAMAAPGLQMATTNSCVYSSRICKASPSFVRANLKGYQLNKLRSSSQISSIQPFFRSYLSTPVKFDKAVTKAMSGTSEGKTISGLPIDLKGEISLSLSHD